MHIDIDLSKRDIQDGKNTFSCDSYMQHSYAVLHKLYGNGKWGGVLVNFRAEQILSKLLPYINWSTRIEHPLKISIGSSLKYSA